MPYKDLHIQKAYQKLWHQRHKDSIRIKIRSKRSKVREFLRSLKDVPCADCGVKFPACCMDFDHVRGTKVFQLSAFHKKCPPNPESVLDEVSKCDIVCSNCHRYRTWRRSQDV